MNALLRIALLLLTSTCWAQTYLGPTHKLQGNPQLVLIEILIRDSAELGGEQVESVTFAGEKIPLRPRDVFGSRGIVSLQKPPGTYSLKWVVQRDRFLWPRTLPYAEEIVISPRDLWVQISINGDQASID